MYREYRRTHPGPRSPKSFGVWKRNGGKDKEGFKWEKNPPNTKSKDKEIPISAKMPETLKRIPVKDRLGWGSEWWHYVRGLKQYNIQRCNIVINETTGGIS